MHVKTFSFSVFLERRIQIIRCLTAAVLLSGLSACSDDDNDGGGSAGPNNVNNPMSFNVSGGMNGEYAGESSIGINVDQDGSALTWENADLSGQDDFWKLEFTYVGNDTVIIAPGTYTLGNLSEMVNGEVDLMATFLNHGMLYEGGMAAAWGSTGDVEGSINVTSQDGDFLEGTFELTLSDSGFGPEPFDDIVITDGVFRARMTIAYIE